MLKVKVETEQKQAAVDINGVYINDTPGVYSHTMYPDKYRFVITPYARFMVEMDSGNLMTISELWYDSVQKYVKTAEKLTLTLENKD